MRRAGAALAQGLPPPSMGELDYAEREVMQLRRVAMPQALGGIAGILLLLFALRYGLGALFSLFALSAILRSQNLNDLSSGQLILYGSLLVNLLILVGIVIGVGVLFNIRNLAYRMPGFSSPVPATRNATWIGYAVVMVGLAVALDVALPAAAQRGNQNAAHEQYVHVTATTDEDGSETFVAVGGDLNVDLSAWPSSVWSGVQFKTSNPSVLTLDEPPSTGAPPIALFTARQTGASRVDATSADGRYTFQVRVTVIP